MVWGIMCYVRVVSASEGEKMRELLNSFLSKSEMVMIIGFTLLKGYDLEIIIKLWSEI